LKNNKVIIFSIIITGLILLSVNAGWCTGETAGNLSAGASALPADLPMKSDSILTILKKFALTMGCVGLSLIIIWFGLNIFKKFKFRKTSSAQDLYNDGLKSPRTVDEAIVLFINKNRLR